MIAHGLKLVIEAGSMFLLLSCELILRAELHCFL